MEKCIHHVTTATCKTQFIVKMYISLITMLGKLLIKYIGIVITFCLNMRSFEYYEYQVIVPILELVY